MSAQGDDGGFVPMDVEVRTDQFDAIDELARESGADHSTVVRRLLDLGLSHERRTDADDDTDRPA